MFYNLPVLRLLFHKRDDAHYKTLRSCRELAYIVYFGLYYNFRHIALHYAVYK